MTPLELRADIPALQDAAYFNFGAHGPSPRYVVDAVTDAVSAHEYDSGVNDPYTVAFDTYEELRANVAAFVGADTDEIALTESTTDGINRVASGFEWGPGDVVVRTDVEHPAGVLPWKRLEEYGVEVREVETTDGQIDLNEFSDAVSDATLACFSAITWTHGTKLPVSDLVDIASSAGVFTLVDAVQVPGQQPFAVHDWGADAVAAAGHKWLLGPWGAGFLYVSQDAAASLSPRSVGYRSVENAGADEISFKPGAKRFEIGSTSLGPHTGLVEAIDAIESVGLDTIESRIEALTDRFKSHIPDAQLLSPQQFESGLVTVRVPDAAAAVSALRDEDIVVRSLPIPNAVRVSIHAVSTETEVDAVADALVDQL